MKGWEKTRLADVTTKVGSGATPRGGQKVYKEVGTPLIRSMNVHFDGFHERGLAFIDDAQAKALDNVQVLAGDVLLNITGASIGRVTVAPERMAGGRVNQHVCIIRTKDALNPGFLSFHLASPDVQSDILSQQTGVTRPALTKGQILDFEVRIPPLPEQHRIVEAIESYLTRLDDAVASLERVQKNLKRYRASVLKAAVEGRLVPTEAELAREDGREYEPASVLLERILKERRRRWEEAEQAKMKAKGTPPKNDKWKEKYKEPVAPDTSDLPELPEGWVWTSVGQIADVTGGLTKNAKRTTYPIKMPYLRVANVYAAELRLDEVLEIGVRESEVGKLLLRRGDLLVVEGNGSIEQLGRVAQWDGSVESCVHQNHLIKVRCYPRSLANWAIRWLLSPGGRKAIEREASSTSGLHTLSISKVQRLPVPLCPTSEQARIVNESDKLLSVTSSLAQSMAYGSTRAARLRQSILKWAFEGKLVDQDPNDEPASVLLERIKAEREAMVPEKKTRRKK